jgi:ubiquinol-cytochrome c reductase subunit 7
MAHQLLPKEEWTKPDEVRTPWGAASLDANMLQDVPYLSDLITDIETEMAEREDLEAMVITKRNRIANEANTNH